MRGSEHFRNVLVVWFASLLACFSALAQGTKPQTIRFVPLADRPVNSAPFQVVALSSAYLPVTLQVQGPAMLQGRLVTLTGVGSITLTASQAGNAEYAPASAQISLQSTPAPSALSWSPPSIPYGTPVSSALLNAAAVASPLVDPAADQATITSQLDTSALGVSGAPTYPAGSPVFRFEGSTVTPTTDPNGGGGYNANTLPAPYALEFRVAFTCDCQQFEFVVQARSAQYRLWVDGAYATTDAILEPLKYPEHNFVLVRFPDKRSRQIKMTVGGNAPFFGINTISGDTITAPQNPIGERVFIFGDSWTGPTILEPILPPAQPGLNGSGYPQTLGEYFNWDYSDDGIGGSGFTVPGTDQLNRTFVQRVVTDVCPNAPQAIVLLGGTNDGNATESAMQTAVSSTLAELKSCLPNVPVYLYGPQFSMPPLDQAVAAAVGAAAPGVSYTDMGNAGWFYGSETDPTTGNNYLYFAGHPTPLGHDYLAEQIAQDLVTKFPDLLPKPYPLSSPVPVAGTTTYSVAPGAILPAGQNPVSITFTPQDAANYAPANFTGTLTVTRATAAVGLSESQANGTVTLQAVVSPQIGGTPTGTVTFLDGGTPFGTANLVNGVATGNFTAATLPGGNHTVTAVYGGDSNFLASPPSAALSVVNTAPDFSFVLKQQQVTLVPGGSATVALQATPVGGLVGALSLSCQGLPKNASCSLTGATFAPNQAPIAATVTIQAFSSSAALGPMSSPIGPRSWPLGEGELACGCLLGTAALWRKRRKLAGPLASALLAVAALSLAAFASGCGSSSHVADATPGTYNVELQLTSGSGPSAITHTQTVTLLLP